MAYNPLYLVFFILALVYAILTLFAVIRTIKLHKFTPRWGHTKAFYATLVASSGLRTIAFLVIFFEGITDLSSFFLLLSVPDSVFTLAFILLFWQLITVFNQAHMYEPMSSHLLRSSAQQRKSRLPPFILSSAVLWSLLQLALYLSYGFEVASSHSVGDEIGVANLFFPTAALVTIITLHVKYSGNPRKSPAWTSKLRKVRWITLLWCVGRYIRGVLSLITEVTDYSLSREVVSKNKDVSLSRLSVLIGYLICCEVICIFLVLDYSFISIFVFIEGEQSDTASLELNTEAGSVRSSLAAEDSPFRQFPPIADRAIVLTSDISFEGEYKSRKGGLGTLLLAKAFGSPVLVRKIVFPRVSGYVIEEFEDEIQALKGVNVPYVLPMYCAAVNIPELWLVTPYVSSGSLYSFLHQTQRPPSPQTQLLLVLRIARAMASLYELGRKHGHLTSHNILIDENGCPYVSDVGMHKLKKYAGLLINYCNKSAWSSPELLQESCATSLKVSESDDVYSFGVILWEVFTGQEPFPGVPRSKLTQLISIDKLRPEIPTTVDDRLAELIKSCWNTIPGRRPSFAVVASTIDMLITALAR